jgi:FkbM family methyltransferase
MLVGSLAGVTVGGGVGFGSGSLSRLGASPSAVAPFEADGAKSSYAQQGEDLVVGDILHMLGVERPSYVDIGAHHPSINSNTYLFYKTGSRGLLVEPNPQYAALLRERRPGDAVLEAGIGVGSAAEADYYVIAGDGQLNTFSKEQADALVKLHGSKVLLQTLRRRLVNVNDALAEHFAAGSHLGSPDFVSIDVEGLDLDILKTLDFRRFRPKVFCVETSLLDGELNRAIVSLMSEQGYEARGGSFVNTVFVDERLRHAGDAGAHHH